MSKHNWATIVYGRSYHLDFRFITIPQDFTRPDLVWASQHILATTQQARNLDRPRWSLFKNDSHCIVGITCMVRDLIGQLSEDLVEAVAKDDRGRPLYVFVGYVTQLSQDRRLLDFPAYTEQNLGSFRPLYHHIEKVWLVKDYEQDRRHPLSSSYQPLDFAGDPAIATESTLELNDRSKHADKVFLWSSFTQQNARLWLRSARCLESTSICLNIQGKPLFNSPFLNQTVTQLDEFAIQDRMVASRQLNSLPSAKNSDSQLNSSFAQKISNRAKEDLDLTLQQAAKVATASQEIIDSFADWSKSSPAPAPQQEPDSQLDEPESFGFKTKKSSASEEQDWF
ncbi:hypothetical protein IQ255_20890 [Pleurocapsales cyanobacterium LEGE 10410]|nr:hypothetical protein [Pleurocapsales cyanobacterium LEGE 10410]